MSRSGPPAASADWKRIAGPPAGPAAEATGSPAARPPVSMGLQFELREQTPRTNERWRGPTARTATTVRPGHGELRLGVRPVILSGRGSWVRTNVSWNQLGYHLNRLNLNPEHHRWLSQLLALHRAVRGVYTSQEADWLYLDDFTSPLLWTLFDEAAAIGLQLVGSKKDAQVTVGRTAGLGLDASTDAVNAGLRLATRLQIDGEAHPAEHAGAIGSHGLYAWALGARPQLTLAPVDRPLSPEQLRLLGQPGTVDVPESDVAEFLTVFYPALRHALPVTSTDASVHFPEADPPVLVLTARFRPKQALELEWHWEHREGARVTRSPLRAAPGSPDAGTPDAGTREAGTREAGTPDAGTREAGTPGAETPDTREAAILAAAADALRLDGHPAPGPAARLLHDIETAEYAGQTLPRLRSVPGVRVDVVGDPPDYRELTAVPELTVTTVETDRRDWFDLGVLVTVDGRSVPFGPLFKALAKGKAKLLLVDNSYLSLRQPVFERLHELIAEARALQEWDTGLRISRHQAALWSEFEDLADETVQAVAWRATVAGLLALTTADGQTAGQPLAEPHSLAEPGSVPLPAGLVATLRPYQLHGFAWLAFLWEHRLGGILADDMGLGKTLQTLALLAHATAQPRTPGRRPFLVVAPTSVVSNWLAEAARFTPGLVVRAVTATEAAGGVPIAYAAAGADVVVTSYALFRLDFEAYQAAGWAGLVLDEAQFVKNRASKVHLCARDLATPFKLALTGTPMENNLLELWALFAIVAPGLFPSARRFAEDYLRPAATGADPALIHRLRRRIRPLMLRRTKDVVAPELPPKQEQTLQIELNPRHRRLYDTFLQRERQKLFGLIEDLDQNRFIVFRSLTLLRMLSLDPSLVDEKYAGVSSSKLDALFDQLADVVAEGHRALVFSQFTSFLTKAAARLDAVGIAYCYLDGSTLHRPAVIDRFKQGTAPVFLISLKAGGFGLNLTEADYVFLLDPWWNPATEMQAVDRTHRIGQTKNVMVYRMVATDTIEEKVMALKEQKAALTGSVLDGAGTAGDAGFSDALTADDIRGLLEP
ncbi:superfamily II DNA or RNA helicase [Cryobacterium sp. MP_M5]|uniref:DEAD/DEAH box helicase n=1 Tax=unclassified Cryobacterium TaxID=2649013 RepID=UPI0018CB8E43|nr:MULTISPECIES: DEAD/DEAH box helicase [unclassified Cryobacterium]MBG6057980.1 superfamily II DNA or RNA helicase [Cryobacterium sp. MP_M3]MEC5176179.1 superfamily II DNA or RNA helicase [Cryobacterium sp. MP_M5]